MVKLSYKDILHALLLIMAGAFMSCQPGEPEELLDKKTAQPAQTFERTDNWNFVSSANYSFDSDRLNFTTGQVSVKQVDQQFNSLSDFNSGTFDNTRYDGSRLTINNPSGLSQKLTDPSMPNYSALVAYYGFDGNYLDESGNGNHGTAFNGVTFNNYAKVGSAALQSDGVDDVVVVSDSGTLDSITTEITLAYWLYIDSDINVDGGNNYRYMFHKGLFGGSSFYNILEENFIGMSFVIQVGGTGFNCNGPNTAGYNQANLVKQWHHVLITIDTVSDSCKFFLNGNMIAERTGVPSGNIDVTAHDLQISSSFAGRSFPGRMDEIGLYKAAFSNEEAKLLFDKQKQKYFGQYTSEIIDIGQSGAWDSLAWRTSRANGKNIPGSQGIELNSEYPGLVNSSGFSGNSDLNTSLLALWHFDGDFNDSSGNNYNGSTPNATYDTSVKKLGRSSAYFDGTDYSAMPGLGSFGSQMKTMDFTVSGWFKNTQTAYTAIFTGVGPGDTLFKLSLNRDSIGDIDFLMRGGIVGASQRIWLTSAALDLSDFNWHHVVIRKSGLGASNIQVFIDGQQIAMVVKDDDLGAAQSFSGLSFGSNLTTAAAEPMTGFLDEFAVWTRALDLAEISDLHRRGVNQVKFQVRSCDDSICNGETWMGPDGTADTYFTEEHNCTAIDGSGLCSGAVNSGPPTMTFTNFVGTISDNQYFQYRTFLESDDNSTDCSGGPCVPGILQIDISPSGRYYGGDTFISSQNAISSDTLEGFTESVSAGCQLTYQISRDRTNYYYYNGAYWALALHPSQSNSAGLVNARIKSFPTFGGSKSFYWRAYINSAPGQTCVIYNVSAKSGIDANPADPATYTAFNWSFDLASNYTYSSSLVEITGGKAVLRQVNQVYDSTIAYGTGTNLGVAYDGTNLTLGSNGNCDGAATNCSGELEDSWTPRYSSLGGYWKLNEAAWTGAADQVMDSSGNGRHGQSGGDAVTTTDAKLGSRAGSFDGSDAVVLLPPSNSFYPTGSQPFSVSMWVKPASLSATSLGNRIFTLAIGPGASAFIVAMGSSSQIQYFVGGVGTTVLSTSPILNEWQHITVSYNGTCLQAYVNGVADGSCNVVTVPGASVDGAKIGTSVNTSLYEFNGQIDDVAFWTASLTSSEVALIYERQVPKFSGKFTSEAIDAGTAVTWTNLDWVTNVPHGKKLPGSVGNEAVSQYVSLVDFSGANADSDLSNNLNGLWHLDETAVTAGVFNDFFDNSVNLAYGDANGGALLDQPGILGNSVYLDGVDDYISWADSGNHDFGTATDFTYSFWFKAPSYVDFSMILSKYSSGASPGYAIQYNGGAVQSFIRDGVGAGAAEIVTATGTTNIVDNRWHLLTVTHDRDGNMTLYVDGRVDAVEDISTITDTVSNTDELMLGRRAAGNYTLGYYDEFAVWSRALAANEVLELYRRGANRVKYRIRSCDDSACSGEDWIGPDGTSDTYFSESVNCSTIDGLTGACTGSINLTTPSVTFTDFVSAPAINRYFQFEALLESDDEVGACAGSTPCMPEIASLEVGPTNRYLNGTATIANNNTAPFTAGLIGFYALEGGTCTVTYQISNNNVNYYYWNGSTWALASSDSHSNSAATVNLQINRFSSTVGTGGVFWKAIFTSNGTQTCELDEVSIGYD